MRKNYRRCDTEAADKILEVRKMMRAFGDTAAMRLGERDFMDPALLRIALSSKYERRLRLRRSTDCQEGTDFSK
jgi:hypothetical protein